MKTDICILGDGIVGRTLALALADQGLHVGLVQPPVAVGQVDVRAYSVTPASRALLESVRGWPQAKASPVRGIQVMDQGRMTVQFESPDSPDAMDATDAQKEAMATIVDAADIEAALNMALDYAPRITRLQAPVDAPLKVFCEGKGRQQVSRVGATPQARPYEQAALACRLSADIPHEGWARQWFDNGDVLGFLGQGSHQLSLVWSTRPENAARLLSLTDEAFCDELMAVGDGASHSVGQLLGGLVCQSQRQSWPLQLSQIDHWSGPGWVAAGDAAHTLHPLTGQGLNLGLGDVASLARHIGQRDYWRDVADPKILRAYERERKAQFAKMGRASDALHGLFTHRHPVVTGARQQATEALNRLVPLKSWVVRQAMGQ
jgi:2-polyprenyl-6-methoxyphenol hydroxylase-like FAD-dependent oxidoreductase